MSKDSSCSDFAESILKLKTLRENLCSTQSEWKKAFELKEFLRTELEELHCMLTSETISKKECCEKVSVILCSFSLEGKSSGDSNASE